MENRRYVTRSWDNDIEQIEITRETEKCYFIPNRYNRSCPEDRRLKNKNYHATWDDAYAYLCTRAERQLEGAEVLLSRYRYKLECVKGIKKPV